MRKFSLDEMKEVLAKHAAWLRNEAGGEWADLSGANLSGANLSRADLSRANLSRADLSRADLSRADLSVADLSGANLSWADLSGANLSGANLSRANLSRANLSGANLSGAKRIKEARWGSPAPLLSASWGSLPKAIGRLAIALDAANHPDGIAPFKAWAKDENGPCPYTNCAWSPVVNFSPDRSHFDEEAKAPTILEMATMLLDYAESKGARKEGGA